MESGSDQVSLTEAIAIIRRDLLRAQRSATHEDIHFPVQGVTIELRVVATRTKDGKAGFSVPLIGMDFGGSAGRQREVTQIVTVTLGPPADRSGSPVEIAEASDELKR